MKIIIIDDEVIAVRYLTKILAEIGKTELIATYTSSLIAKDEIVDKQPEIVFLNVVMPKLNGLALKKYIEDKLPMVKIIFITSKEYYTFHASDIGENDYIIKPYEPTLIAEKLNELSLPSLKKAESLPMVCLLGELRFIYYEKNQDIEVTQNIDGKWRTKLARELFIYMINSRGQSIRKDVLVELFWPELSVKDGFNILYATIHYMRKFLNDIDFPIIIENADDYYLLNLNGVIVDIDYWIEKTREFGDPMDPEFQQVTKLYRNHYLANESYTWIEYNRQRYRIQWLSVIRYIINELERQKEYTVAILYALSYQHIEPYMEESYFILMKLFGKTRDYKSVTHQYKRLVDMMEKEYNDNPAKEIVEWYETWISTHS